MPKLRSSLSLASGHSRQKISNYHLMSAAVG